MSLPFIIKLFNLIIKDIKLDTPFKEVAIWGRNLIEYIRMFYLPVEFIQLKILDCAGGPSSFNYEMTKLGCSIISCDPIYALSKNKIEEKINETYEIIINELAKENEVKSQNDFINVRLSAMKLFLDDYEKGKAEKRYIFSELPNLPFSSNQFDILLCSNFLFTYTHLLTLEFHIDSIREMSRVANEVRIFPVCTMDREISDYLKPITEVLSKENYLVELLTVNYEIQNGANQILIVKKI